MNEGLPYSATALLPCVLGHRPACHAAGSWCTPAGVLALESRRLHISIVYTLPRYEKHTGLFNLMGVVLVSREEACPCSVEGWTCRPHWCFLCHTGVSFSFASVPACCLSSACQPSSSPIPGTHALPCCMDHAMPLAGCHPLPTGPGERPQVSGSDVCGAAEQGPTGLTQARNRMLFSYLLIPCHVLMQVRTPQPPALAGCCHHRGGCAGWAWGWELWSPGALDQELLSTA